MTTTVHAQNITRAVVKEYPDFFTIDFHSGYNRAGVFFSASDYTAQDYEAISAACCQLANAINNAKKEEDE